MNVRPNHFVSWLHIGDLHASDEDGWRSVDALDTLVDQMRSQVRPGSLDFAFLPGDNANHGAREQLAAARAASEPRPLVFMHAFPEDLHEGAGSIGRLFAEAQVAFVDTGHTHYNEGMAVGMPADADAVARRTATLDVHALVLGPDVASVEVRVDDGPPVAMQPDPRRQGLWIGTVDRALAGTEVPGDRACRLLVQARSAHGETATDAIECAASATRRRGDAFGQHRHSVGAWPTHGLLGTRLGPNANGKHW